MPDEQEPRGNDAILEELKVKYDRFKQSAQEAWVQVKPEFEEVLTKIAEASADLDGGSPETTEPQMGNPFVTIDDRDMAILDGQADEISNDPPGGQVASERASEDGGPEPEQIDEFWSMLGRGIKTVARGLFSGLASSLDGATADRAQPESPAADGVDPAASLRPADLPSERDRLRRMLELDVLEIHLGLDLVPLVDMALGGSLLDRITNLRRTVVAEMGFIIPPIHIRDNLQLPSSAYMVLLSGEVIGAGQILMDKLLAIELGDLSASVDGIETKEPTYGMKARWIEPADRELAVSAGYMVCDADTVITTHVAELVKQHAAELIGLEEVQELLDIVQRQYPTLVRELVPSVIRLSGILKVLQNLLAERVPIRDMRSILETLLEHAPSIQDPGELTERIRQRIKRTITRMAVDTENTLHVITLDREAHHIFDIPADQPLHDATAVQSLLSELGAAVAELLKAGKQPVLLTDPEQRRQIVKFTSRAFPELLVISYLEVAPNVEIRPSIRLSLTE